MPNHIESKPTGGGQSAGKAKSLPQTPDITPRGAFALLSRAQVAQRLGVCRHTVQRLTRRGILPAIIFNRRLIRYAPAAVEAYIQSAVVGNGAVR